MSLPKTIADVGADFPASALTGSEIIPIEQGGTKGATATQLQTFVLADRGINIKEPPYGAKGDGITDDTAAWLAFKSYCISSGSAGWIPAGTYLIDAFSLANHSGLKLYGASNNPNFAQVSGTPQTTLKLRSAGSTFVTINGVYDLDIQNIHFDGGQFADSVLAFTGANPVTDCTFERCSFDGATPTTGVTINFSGTVEVDYTRFRYCNIGQILGGNGATLAASLITNTNSNAFNISFEHCRFQDAVDMFVFGAGSCSFYRCDYFNASTTFYKISSVTQSFSIIDPYTEQAPGVPFFQQAGAVGITNGKTITIGLGGQLNDTNDIQLNCQQPVRIMGIFTGGNIDVTPMATYGTQYVYADNVGFAAGKGWTGTGYPSQVISLNENDNLTPAKQLIGPTLARLIVDSGTNNNPAIPAIKFPNGQIITWLDAASGFTNCGFVWFDGSNNMNLGARNNTVLIVQNASVKPAAAGGYHSSDDSAGISTTITTAGLVGKTITVKDGIITGFA